MVYYGDDRDHNRVFWVLVEDILKTEVTDKNNSSPGNSFLVGVRSPDCGYTLLKTIIQVLRKTKHSMCLFGESRSSRRGEHNKEERSKIIIPLSSSKRSLSV